MKEWFFPKCNKCKAKKNPGSLIRYLNLYYCTSCVDEKKCCNKCSQEHHLELFQYCTTCHEEYCYLCNCKCADEMILNAEEKFANCPSKGKEMGKYHGTFSGRCDICYYPLIIETQKEKTYIAIHPDQMYCNCRCKFDLLHFPRRIFCEVCNGTWKMKGNYCVDCDDEIDNERKEKKCNRCLEFYEKHGVCYLCNLCKKQLGVSWLEDKNESIWVCSSCKFLQTC